MALVRRAGLRKGTRFASRLENGSIILEPQADIGQTVKGIQTKLRPLIRKPLSDDELQEALHGWPEGKPAKRSR